MKKNTKIIIGILSIVIIACVAVVLLFMGQAEGKADYDKHLTVSQKYVDELDYEKAIAELEFAIEIEANNAKAYVALAEVYVEMGDYESAISVLEEAKDKVDDVIEINSLLFLVKKSAEKQEVNKEMTLGYEDGSYDVYTYDKKGRLVKETWYAADGSIYMYGLKEYDDEGNKISDEWYDGEGNSVNATRTRYEYYGDDRYKVIEYEKSNQVKISEYVENGKLIIYHIFEYNTNDQCIKVSGYDQNGNSIKDDYYDSNGKLIGGLGYSYSEDISTGNMMFTGYDIYIYDSKGNTVKTYGYDQSGNFINYSLYDYDANGNCVKYDNYDANGNLVSTNEYDANGNLISTHEY